MSAPNTAAKAYMQLSVLLPNTTKTAKCEQMQEWTYQEGYALTGALKEAHISSPSTCHQALDGLPAWASHMDA